MAVTHGPGYSALLDEPAPTGLVNRTDGRASIAVRATDLRRRVIVRAGLDEPLSHLLNPAMVLFSSRCMTPILKNALCDFCRLDHSESPSSGIKTPNSSHEKRAHTVAHCAPITDLTYRIIPSQVAIGAGIIGILKML
jgi:hypothetical protein